MSSIKQPAVLDALYAIGCMNLRSHTEKQFADNIQKLHEQFVKKQLKLNPSFFVTYLKAFGQLTE